MNLFAKLRNVICILTEKLSDGIFCMIHLYDGLSPKWYLRIKITPVNNRQRVTQIILILVAENIFILRMYVHVMFVYHYVCIRNEYKYM